MSYQVIFTDSLYHHGIKGQRWGIRRFQNEDGSYKPGAQGRYNDDGIPGPNKSRSGKSVNSKKSEEKNTNKSKYVKAAAIVAGTAAVTAAIVYAKKSGALDRGMDFIKNNLKKENAQKPVSQLKPKADISKELEKFENMRKVAEGQMPRVQVPKTQVPRVDVQRTQVPRVQVQRTSTPKKLSDFEFVRRGMMRADGKIDYIDVPKDKAGYAKSFAQQMARGQTSGKDYDYWLKYMESKLRTM